MHPPEGDNPNRIFANMKMKKMTILPLALAILTACGSDSPDNPVPNPTPTPGGDNPGIGVTSTLQADITTDKARYAPGDKIVFKADNVPAGAKIRYRRGSEVVATADYSSPSWEWTAPATDNVGYMVDLYGVNGDTETIYGTIGVDVSSDWTTFPRYGFVATFDPAKSTPGAIEKEMEYLNRCHINAVQFQDWHNKHHWPLGGTRDQLLPVYKDIAMRDISTEVVKKYIDVQHGYGMKSIFYNLAFGALDDAASDGVKEEWYLFKDRNHSQKDYHGLKHMGWKSDIFLVDPGNTSWQNYIADRNDDVYYNFDFDGYQIDQLGYRGDLYTYSGDKANLPAGYQSFIKAMKKRHPSKTLIMNAVSSYGAQQIVESGGVGFCYNEVWNDQPEFKDLQAIIKANDTYGNGALKTIFAAYMNYNKTQQGPGQFNTPGVLLTDAVMFALGGAHLELGDHMLGSEYFPNTNLAMNQELRLGIVRYYDFMTAYQHLLRGKGSSAETKASISTDGASKSLRISAFPAQKGTIASYSKMLGNMQTIHLLNFLNIDNLNWCDTNGERPAPRLVKDLNLKVKADRPVKKVWVASPDLHGGVPVALAFKQSGSDLTFTVPSLRYWDMIVVEY